MTTSDRLWRLHAGLWWVLCPAFFLLVARFSYERGCLDAYELLRPLMRHQASALIIAATYTGAYVWIVAIGVAAARAIASAGNRPHAIGIGLKIVAMSAVIALDQVPRAVWAWLYHALGVC